MINLTSDIFEKFLVKCNKSFNCKIRRFSLKKTRLKKFDLSDWLSLEFLDRILKGDQFRDSIQNQRLYYFVAFSLLPVVNLLDFYIQTDIIH